MKFKKLMIIYSKYYILLVFNIKNVINILNNSEFLYLK